MKHLPVFRNLKRLLEEVDPLRCGQGHEALKVEGWEDPTFLTVQDLRDVQHFADRLVPALRYMKRAYGPALDHYEGLAEEFRRECGMMAPGKDAPAELGEPFTYEERRTRWILWLEERRIIMLGNITRLLADLTEERTDG